MKTFAIAVCVALAAGGSFISSASAAYIFTRLVGAGDPAPGGGTFNVVEAAHGVGGAFAFRGTSGSTSGLYIGTPGGPIGTIADSNTVVPNTGGATFTSFPAFYGTTSDRVVFTGSAVLPGSGTPQSVGVYSYQGGALSVVADRTTAFVGGTGTFGSFNSRSDVSGSSAVFVGSNSAATETAVFTSDASGIHRVVDKNTVVTGGGTISNFASPAIAGQDITFLASGGIYVRRGSDGALIRAVGLLSTPVPDVTPVDFFGETFLPFLHDGAVTFAGDRSILPAPFRYGTYRYDIAAGSLARVADITMPAPGGSGNFDDFTISFASGDSTIFDAYAPFLRGLYLRDGGGVVSEIIGGGDMLDGHQVQGIVLNDVQDGRAYFTASFSDAGPALYSVAVPEPAAVSALLLTALLRRRRVQPLPAPG